jgi:(2Fe-2S) ferredoxin
LLLHCRLDTLERVSGKDIKKARDEARKRQVDSVERHLFICTGPDCIDRHDGEKVWDHVKKRVGEAQKSCPGTLYRTRAACLRICEAGPIGVVFPEGTWYAGLDAKAVDRVIEKHLLGGQVVEDLVIGRERLHRAHEGGGAAD